MSDGLDRFPQVDLDLKALVVEAYHLGMHELLYIVPFVAKVLESCAKSKVRLWTAVLFVIRLVCVLRMSRPW